LNSCPRTRIVTGVGSVTSGRLGAGRFELRIELIEVRDQLVDALHGILTALVRSEQLRLERSDATVAFFELAPQVGRLAAKAGVGLGESGYRIFEPIEVVARINVRRINVGRVDVRRIYVGRITRSGIGNGTTPLSPGTYRGSRQRVKRRTRSNRVDRERQTCLFRACRRELPER
jgi:hypothetical protein